MSDETSQQELVRRARQLLSRSDPIRVRRCFSSKGNWQEVIANHVTISLYSDGSLTVHLGSICVYAKSAYSAPEFVDSYGLISNALNALRQYMVLDDMANV